MTPSLETAAAHLRQQERWKPMEFAFWALALVAPFVFPDDRLFLSQIAILGLFCLSLDLILGIAGILSLGQAAFFGLGGYAAGLFSIYVSGDPLVGLVVAAALAGLLGLFTAPLLLGGKDLTRLLITVAVAGILYEAANKWSAVTGGVDGLQGIVINPLLGLVEFDLGGTVAYWYALAVLFVVFLGLRRLKNSPFGLALTGIRLNVQRMPALGVPVSRRLTVAYAIGGAVAGIAGALLTQTNQFVSLDALSFHRSAELMLILVLGGTGNLYGALLGTIVFSVAHHLLSEINPMYWQFWMGTLLILIVLFARDGLTGGLRRLRDRLVPGGAAQ